MTPEQTKELAALKAALKQHIKDKKTKDAEALVRGSYLESDGPMFTTPVQLTMTFFPDKTEVTISEVELNAASAVVSSASTVVVYSCFPFILPSISEQYLTTS